MSCAQVLFSLFLLSPCEHGGGQLEAIEAAVANPARAQADVQRDQDRKPTDVLSFLGISPGMTVLDVFAGGGYYSEILNYVVGEDGKVLLHNNLAYISFVESELEPRLADGRLANISSIIAEAKKAKMLK